MRFILNLCIHLRFPYMNKFFILLIISVRNQIKHLRLRDLLVKYNFTSFFFQLSNLSLSLFSHSFFFLIVVIASNVMHLKNVGNQILLLEGVQFIENFNTYMCIFYSCTKKNETRTYKKCSLN